MSTGPAEGLRLPDDPTLSGLAVIRSCGVSGVLPDLDLGDGPLEVTLRGHTPRKLVTLEVKSAQRHLAVKIHARDPQPEIELHEALAAEFADPAAPQVPHIVACERRLGIVACEWLEGPDAGELLRAGYGARAGALAASWIKRAAMLPIRLGDPLGAARLLQRMSKWVVTLGVASAPLGAAAEAQAQLLEESRPKGFVTRLVHASTHCEHVLDAGGRVGLISWSHSAQGPLELDASLFLASVAGIGLESAPLAGEATRARDAFFAVVGEALDPQALAWFQRAALLRLASMALDGKGDRLVNAGALLAAAERSPTVAPGRPAGVRRAPRVAPAPSLERSLPEDPELPGLVAIRASETPHDRPRTYHPHGSQDGVPMENTAHTDLIRRASICGMSIVLDERVFLETLKRIAPQADLRRAEITYVSLMIPNFCRVGYRVDIGGEPLELDVRAGRPEDVPEWRAAEFREPIPGPLGRGRVLLEESAILINVFPNDAKLREIQHLTDAEERPQVLRDLFPKQSEYWDGEFRSLRYRAERRFVGELHGTNGAHAVVKACTHRAYMRSKRNAMAFQNDGPLRIASLIGASDNRRLLAYEWVPGRALYDIFIERDAPAEPMKVAGAALATMHAQQPEGLSYWTREAQAAHLRAVAEEIGFVCPPLADRAQAVAIRFEDELPETAPDPVAIHGDISARHLLVDGDQTAIIDLDWACYGDAADDLGYLIAHVERAAVTGKTASERVDQFREAMIEGYGRDGDADLRKRIDLYTGIGLFQQARFPFRSWRPNWPQTTEVLLARTETYANGLSG